MKNKNNQTIKAGCFLVNRETRKIAIIYREKQKDYSFPKGHLEENETLIECALRETAEETKRDGNILDETPIIDIYKTGKGEECICYYYIAEDIGKSDNTSTDTHNLVWIDIDKVEEVLTYPHLIDFYKNVKDKILKLIND